MDGESNNASPWITVKLQGLVVWESGVVCSRLESRTCKERWCTGCMYVGWCVGWKAEDGWMERFGGGGLASTIRLGGVHSAYVLLHTAYVLQTERLRMSGYEARYEAVRLSGCQRPRRLKQRLKALELSRGKADGLEWVRCRCT